VAIVWSMQTMTTVGYGEVIATTDAEHAYIYCAMIVGGASSAHARKAAGSVLRRSWLRTCAPSAS